ncbi:MAG: hypothetical protein IBX55_16970 [Methyloprofundus sp.]|nr:hypothetical protein [Methyloprofundus sp.]
MQNANFKPILESHGAFFAFSLKQFDPKASPDVKYVDMGGGLLCPKDKVESLTEAFEVEVKRAASERLEKEGKRGIIWYELGNHEAQITGDITDTVEAVEVYGITAEEVRAVWPEYFQHCVDNDCF